MEGPADHQYDMVAVGEGRRIIGQLEGHEIHLEIEDALDKNKNKSNYKQPDSPKLTKLFTLSLSHF